MINIIEDMIFRSWDEMRRYLLAFKARFGLPDPYPCIEFPEEARCPKLCQITIYPDLEYGFFLDDLFPGMVDSFKAHVDRVMEEGLQTISESTLMATLRDSCISREHWRSHEGGVAPTPVADFPFLGELRRRQAIVVQDTGQRIIGTLHTKPKTHAEWHRDGF